MADAYHIPCAHCSHQVPVPFIGLYGYGLCPVRCECGEWTVYYNSRHTKVETAVACSASFHESSKMHQLKFFPDRKSVRFPGRTVISPKLESQFK